MRSTSVFRLLPLLLATLACSTLLPAATPTRPPATAFPPTAFPSLTPRATRPPAAAPVPTEPPASPPGDILFQPGPFLYSGDLVSLAVVGQPAWRNAQVTVFYGDPSDGVPVSNGAFGTFGLGGRPQATFWWAWDTAGLTGDQTLTAVVTPAAGGAPLATLTRTVKLWPADQRPQPEPQARWAQAESACCVFHYLTGTAAARDIDSIKTEADEAFTRLEAALGVQPRAKVAFTFLSRLLGHGGFADDEIYITYIDRNPAGLDLPTVFVHEGAHILDRQITEARPAMLAEGLAVFVAGGHYHPEDLQRRAAALLTLDRYIPLRDLARDFYNAQHEIGYLEAGAFIQYLVEAYGWEQFRAMYAAFPANVDDARMVADGLAAHYGRPLEALEAEWLARLRAQPADPDEAAHLRLTLALYDTLRRYQQLNDPAAYFLTAWLPNGPEARRRGVTADFLRSPHAAENIALEAMLAAAEQALTRREFAAAEDLITAVNRVLEARNLFFDPLAARYLRAVTDLAARGYELQTLELAGAGPQAWAIRDWPTLENIPLYNSGQ